LPGLCADRFVHARRVRLRWQLWNRGLLYLHRVGPHNGEASLTLTRNEALYLQERIRAAAGDSMLWQLFRAGPLPDAEYPWLHPRFGDLPEELQSSLSHARCFAEVMHGAAILYNLMLAEAGTETRRTISAASFAIGRRSCESANATSALGR